MTITKQSFGLLHTAGDPLVLFNIWDAGSAKAVCDQGAKAIATGSLALAGSQGFHDGEDIPFEDLLKTVRQIKSAINVPLTVDIETGYADHIQALTQNATSLVKAGAVGCNLEDRILGQASLRDPAEQAVRIDAVGAAGLFVNARTDLFLGPLMAGEDPNRLELVEAAIERAAIFQQAGAGCFFAPGLGDPDLIALLCKEVQIPVNIMRLDGMAENAKLGALGVSRISYGPGPWMMAMQTVAAEAKAAFIRS